MPFHLRKCVDNLHMSYLILSIGRRGRARRCFISRTDPPKNALATPTEIQKARRARSGSLVKIATFAVGHREAAAGGAILGGPLEESKETRQISDYACAIIFPHSKLSVSGS